LALAPDAKLEQRMSTASAWQRQRISLKGEWH